MKKQDDTAIGVLMLAFKDFVKMHGDQIIDVYCQMNNLSDQDWKELMSENDSYSNVLALASDIAFAVEEKLA